MKERLYSFLAFAGAGIELALAGALAAPLSDEDDELEDWGLLEEQPATASAMTATTPTDLVALERITGIDPFT